MRDGGITWPFIKGQVLYTLPASIPATNAPVNMFKIKHLIKTIPIIRIDLKYLIFAVSEGSTYVGFISNAKEFQIRPA